MTSRAVLDPVIRRYLWGVLVSSIGFGLVLPFLFVYLTTIRGLEAGVVGLLVGWVSLVALGTSPIAGILVDRLGCREVMLPAFGLLVVGTGGLAFVHDAWQALMVMTLSAVGGSALWVGQSTLVAQITTEPQRQRVFGLQFMMLNIGVGVGGVFAGLSVDAREPATFQVLYLLSATGYVLFGVVVLTIRPRRTTVADGEPAASIVPRGGYRLVLSDRPFRRLVLVGFILGTCGYSQIEVGLPAFATQVGKVSPRVIAMAFVINTVAVVVLQLLAFRFLEGRSRTHLLAAVGLIWAGAWVVTGILGALPGSMTATVGIFSFMAIFALGEVIYSSVVPALNNALAPDELRGRYNAVSSTVWGLSGVVGPAFAGPLIGLGLSRLWLVIIVVGCLAGWGLTLSMLRIVSPEHDQPAPTRE